MFKHIYLYVYVCKYIQNIYIYMYIYTYRHNAIHESFFSTDDCLVKT